MLIHLENLLHQLMQVFISYGKKSNGELLLSYGFVPREGTNPSDSVELPLSLKKSDKCYKEKLEALRKYGMSAWVPDGFALLIGCSKTFYQILVNIRIKYICCQPLYNGRQPLDCDPSLYLPMKI